MCEKALGLEQALVAGDSRNTDLRRMAAWETLRTGEEIFAQGNAAEAIDRYRQSLSEMQALSAADPKSVQFHSDVAAVLARLGAAHLAGGNPDAALAELQHSLSQIDAFSAGVLDNDTLEVKAQDQFRIAQAYQKLGQKQQAESWFRQSVPTLEEASRRGGLRGDAAAMLAESRSH
jgi:tetratricopeptide (TPR) repeat protein